jgi:hemolysin D
MFDWHTKWQGAKHKVANGLARIKKWLTQSLATFTLPGLLRSERRHHRRQATKELLDRYKSAFTFWWEQRDQIKTPELKTDEAQFLPAALAIQASPVSPAGRLVARILIGLIITAFLWALIGKMDIIVNGQGKIIAGGYTKTIASVEIAKVVGLYVENGQHVQAGDLLIELDARGSQSEELKAEGDRQLALLQMERSKALLQSLANNKEPILPVIDGINLEHYQNEKIHLQDVWRDFLAKRNRINSQIQRFANSLPLAIARAQSYALLVKDRDVSEHAYFEKEQARIELQGQLDDAKAQLATLMGETRKTAQDELYQATRIWSGAVQDSNKASARTEQLKIVAPVDGVVQQLTAHTIGGVVPSAQPLMLIVPNKHHVELEAYIENKDIGFISEGQSAQVKIDAYEYSKYGTVPAIVTHVSRDAVDFSGNGTGQLANKDSDPKKEASGNKGLMYAVKVALQKTSITVNGKEKAITPGMSASIEIKTGERRIIQYILSPLMIHAHESLNER